MLGDRHANRSNQREDGTKEDCATSTQKIIEGIRNPTGTVEVSKRAGEMERRTHKKAMAM